MRKSIYLFLLSLCLVACGNSTEVCIYGGTSASVTAAYAAAHEGGHVVIVCPDVTIGGMTTGGLGQTDIGNKQAVVGLARRFYRELGTYYGKLEQWLFEPHVAEDILMKWLDNPRITLQQGFYLESVEKEGTRIISITCRNKAGEELILKADQFIDCSYEGDLMAKAGVSYRVGREDNSEYGEEYNGYQMRNLHQFPDGIDPYREEGNPESGLLWGISDAKEMEKGTGNDMVQAYNYRLCFTEDPENRLPIERPERYDSTRYELLLRLIQHDENPTLGHYMNVSRMPNHKTDINNNGAFSTDMIGMNHNYPEATWEEREKILQDHLDYTLGLLYFIGNDERVPEKLRNEMLHWGLPKDEYPRTNHWTHQLYIRECRRLVGEYVATQADCQNKTAIEDGIGWAAYTMDSHNCQRIVVEKDGKMMVKNEGDVQIHGGHPYPISYRSLTPKREECTNLLVPVCLSASHIAYGSIRMEPVFLGMGQMCGLAAAWAGKKSVQEVDVKRLQNVLATDPFLDGREPETLIDEDSELISGREGWETTSGWGAYGNTLLRFNGNPEDNKLVYHLPATLDGEYNLYAFQQRDGCPHTTFEIQIAGETTNVPFERSSLLVEGQTAGEWVCLGKYRIPRNSEGTIRFLSEEKELRADAILVIPAE